MNIVYSGESVYNVYSVYSVYSCIAMAYFIDSYIMICIAHCIALLTFSSIVQLHSIIDSTQNCGGGGKKNGPSENINTVAPIEDLGGRRTWSVGVKGCSSVGCRVSSVGKRFCVENHSFLLRLRGREE